MRGRPTWRRVKQSAPRATKGLETSGAIAYGTIVPRRIVNCAAPVNWRSVLNRRITRARLRRGPNGKRRVSAPGTALGHQGGAPGLGTGLGMDCAAQERSPRTRGDSRKKHPAGLGGRHQLAYEDACVAAVAGGRWRESARVWTENNSFFKRAYATESIYREWDRFSKGERKPP